MKGVAPNNSILYLASIGQRAVVPPTMYQLIFSIIQIPKQGMLSYLICRNKRHFQGFTRSHSKIPGFGITAVSPKSMLSIQHHNEGWMSSGW